MSVSEEERSLRRRLVANAMPESASVDVINQAIAILENEFGDEPQIKYSQLVKRLGESIEGNVKFGSVLGKIMVMRRKPVEEIGPDPGIVESSQSIVKLAAQDVVFNAMFLSIAQQIHQRGATMESDFGSWLSSDAKSWSLTSECLSAIEQWASNPQSAVKMSGSVEQLQLSLIHI